ncbi:MAG: exodeoxyribonuclease VII large subunit [Deltaproteobacteria bacterium]|nr:exodeoxyribonuclease VII large subunit [Deltaproteobacteria bacterium]MBI2501224.1 exodeoxyribonuclease VII large subunit [Deltaproteobacteria bacterium]
MRVYSVTEINREVKQQLESGWSDICVQGEISNFRRSQKGHCYFSLKDERSQLEVVLFQGAASRLRFLLENGLSVRAFGSLTLYEAAGRYQLTVVHLEPEGPGELQLAFEQLKKRLEVEGLFDTARKRPLPKLPRTIGLVTSLQGAVIRDMIHVARRRYPNIEILIAPAPVQGREAAPEIADAIRNLDAEEIDLLIVGRGGGSIEDLWGFNEEVVARAIFQCRHPVISAVGHETDFTIADFVADLRAPTPSAAAELAVPVREEIEATLQDLREQLAHLIKSKIGHERLRLKQWRGYLRDPRRWLEERLLRLDALREKMKLVVSHQISALSEKLLRFKTHLRVIGPLATLERGYAIAVGPSGIPLRDADQVRVDDLVTIRLARGSLTSRVTQKNR